MTLGELAYRYRLELQDEAIDVRKSWEEMFRYSFRHCSEDADLSAFDLKSLSDRMLTSGMTPQIVEGYMKRWADLLIWAKAT